MITKKTFREKNASLKNMLSIVILLVATFLTAYGDPLIEGQHPCNQKLQRVMDCAASFATEVELFGKYSPIRAKPNCTFYSKLECCVSVELGISGCRDPKAIEKEIDNAIFEHPAYANCPRGLCDVSNINISLKILQKIDQSLKREKQESNIRKDHPNNKVPLRRLLAADEGDVAVESTATTNYINEHIKHRRKHHRRHHKKKSLTDNNVETTSKVSNKISSSTEDEGLKLDIDDSSSLSRNSNTIEYSISSGININSTSLTNKEASSETTETRPLKRLYFSYTSNKSLRKHQWKNVKTSVLEANNTSSESKTETSATPQNNYSLTDAKTDMKVIGIAKITSETVESSTEIPTSFDSNYDSAKKGKRAPEGREESAAVKTESRSESASESPSAQNYVAETQTTTSEDSGESVEDKTTNKSQSPSGSSSAQNSVAKTQAKTQATTAKTDESTSLKLRSESIVITKGTNKENINYKTGMINESSSIKPDGDILDNERLSAEDSSLYRIKKVLDVALLPKPNTTAQNLSDKDTKTTNTINRRRLGIDEKEATSTQESARKQEEGSISRDSTSHDTTSVSEALTKFKDGSNTPSEKHATEKPDSEKSHVKSKQTSQVQNTEAVVTETTYKDNITSPLRSSDSTAASSEILKSKTESRRASAQEASKQNDSMKETLSEKDNTIGPVNETRSNEQDDLETLRKHLFGDLDDEPRTSPKSYQHNNLDKKTSQNSKYIFNIGKQEYHSSSSQEKDILDEVIDRFGYKWDTKQKAWPDNIHGSLKNDYSNELHNQYRERKALDEELQKPQQNSAYSNLSPIKRIQNNQKHTLPKKAEFYHPDKDNNLLSGISEHINPHNSDFVPSKKSNEKNRKTLDALISELDSILDSDIEEPDTEPKTLRKRINKQNAEFARQSADEIRFDDKSLDPHGRVIYKDALIHRRFWIERQKESPENSSKKEDSNSTNKTGKDGLETFKQDDGKSRVRMAIAARERHMKSASSSFLLSDDRINQKLKKPMMLRSNRGSKPTSYEDDEDDDDDEKEDDDDDDLKPKPKIPKDAKNASNQSSSNSSHAASKPLSKARGFLRNDLSSDCVRDTLIAHTQYCESLLSQHQPMIEEAKKTSSKKNIACYKLESVSGCLGAGEYFSKCDGKEALEYTDLEHRITSDKSALHCDGSLLQGSLILLLLSFCVTFCRRDSVCC